MATAATGEQEFDIFTCPICLEKLKSPKSLPCSHSFCEVCIGEFILSTERRTGHKLSSYPCPVCRADVTSTNQEDETSQWASTLPQNLSFPSQMDQSESKKQECHLCKTENNQNVAAHWCRDCSDAFCDDCLRIHNRMKFSADHKIVKIEEISQCASVGESDFSLISDSCPIHKSKILEAFCFDHQTLCCVLCLTLQHRKCEKVHAIDEIQNLDKDIILSQLKSELIEMKNKVNEFKTTRGIHKKKLDVVFTEMELNARKNIDCLKKKLNSLLAVFVKELNLKREEQRVSSEEKMDAFDKLLSYIEQLQNASKTVEDHCNLNQTFIFFERSKTDIKAVVKESRDVINTESIDNAAFTFCKILEQASNVSSLGIIKFSRSISIERNTFDRQLYPSKSILLVKSMPPLCYDNISLKRTKSFSLKAFAIYGCVFASDTIVVLGGREACMGVQKGKVKVLDITNGSITSEYSIEETVKRLSYDIESKSLFISCYDSKLLSVKFAKDLNSPVNIKTMAQNVGATCVFEKNLYVVADNALQKVGIEKAKEEAILKTCFKTNTDCKSLNGLDIDCKNKRVLYTSSAYEVLTSIHPESPIIAVCSIADSAPNC
ncbi:E3 ubiquitin-protein ligase TRIM33-like [Mytilus trossulus]|uniref:E3 ubiquitin-protein ligase TRIM33-like n=1 Tax=Mytilus trossulus TaxID=6551 RepID=UPI003004F429